MTRHIYFLEKYEKHYNLRRTNSKSQINEYIAFIQRYDYPEEEERLREMVNQLNSNTEREVRG